MVTRFLLVLLLFPIACGKLRCPAPSGILPANMATFTFEGITVTVSGVLNTDFGAWHDGMMWILPTTTISGWTPATATRSNGRYVNGGQLNPTGIQTETSLDSADGYGFRVGVSSTNPPSMSVGDVLVIGRSVSDANQPFNNVSDRPPGEWVYDTWNHQILESVLTIHCVAAAPSADAFRPPVSCSAVHRQQFCITQLQADSTFEDAVTALPTDVDSSDPAFPDLLDIREHFIGFSGEVRGFWATNKLMPRWHSTGYAPTNTQLVSMALLMLCSDMASVNKIALAKLLVQRGLDYAGAWLNGNAIDDGHGFGRKSLILLAGKLLGIPWMEDIDATLGTTTVRFPESNGGNWFDGTNIGGGLTSFAWWHDPTWTVGWRTGQYQGFDRWPTLTQDPWFYQPDWDPTTPFAPKLAGTQVSFIDSINGPQLRNHPRDWTRYTFYGQWTGVPDLSDMRKMFDGYYSDHHECLVGTVLAMLLMDLDRQHGRNLLQGMDQFFAGPSAAADLELQSEQPPQVVYWGTSAPNSWPANQWALLR